MRNEALKQDAATVMVGCSRYASLRREDPSYDQRRPRIEVASDPGCDPRTQTMELENVAVQHMHVEDIQAEVAGRMDDAPIQLLGPRGCRARRTAPEVLLLPSNKPFAIVDRHAQHLLLPPLSGSAYWDTRPELVQRLPGKTRDGRDSSG